MSRQWAEIACGCRRMLAEYSRRHGEEGARLEEAEPAEQVAALVKEFMADHVPLELRTLHTGAADVAEPQAALSKL